MNLFGSVKDRVLYLRIGESGTGFKEFECRDERFVFVGGNVFNLSGNSEDEVYSLYHREGYDFPRKLKGDPIVILWDNEQLVLVRDKFGVNPIYYLVTDGSFAFSTSLSHLVNATGVKKEIDYDSLYMFFSLNVILPPKTIYRDVFSVRPGECVSFRNSRIHTHTYFCFGMEKKAQEISDRELLVSEFYAALRQAIERRMAGVSRIGVLLSGGIDSAFLLSILVGMRPEERVFAFTMGPWGKDSSELEYARLSAAHVGAEHVGLYADERILDALPSVVSLLEQPNGDAAGLAIYLLSQQARRHDVDTLFDGANADTILGALPYVKWVYRGDIIQRCTPPPLRKPLFKIGSVLPWQRLRRAVSFTLGQDYIQKWMHFKQSLCLSEACGELFPFGEELPREHVFRLLYDFHNAINHSNVAQRTIYLDERFGFTPQMLEILHKLTPGLNLRLPFYDDDLVELAVTRVPQKFRAEKNWDKMILRDAAKGIVHPRLYKKPMKGLLFPMNKWFDPEGLLFQRLMGYLKRNPAFQSFINPDGLEYIVSNRLFDYGDIAYKALLFVVWHRLALENGPDSALGVGLEETLDYRFLSDSV